MRSLSRTPRLELGVATLLGAWLLPSAGLFAQAPGAEPRPVRPRIAQPRPVERVVALPEATPSPTVVSIRFEGGPLVEYVDQLSKLAGVNVVLSAEVKEAKLPPFELRNVEAAAALQLVPEIAEAPEGTRLTSTVLREGSMPIWVFKAEREVQTFVSLDLPSPKDPAAILEIISLNEVIRPLALGAGEPVEGVDAETILSAIDEALEEPEGSEVPATAIKYHPESGLLMVRGTPEQIEVARDVVEKISQYHTTRQQLAAQGQGKRASELHQALLREHEVSGEEMKLRIEEVEEERDELRTEIEVMMKQHEAEVRAFDDRLMDMQMRFQRLQETSDTKVRELMMKIEKLQKALEDRGEEPKA